MTITIFPKKNKRQILSPTLRSLAWFLEAPVGLAKWPYSLWRCANEITGQISLCHSSCYVESITLLSRVGTMKLVVCAFQLTVFSSISRASVTSAGVLGSGALGPHALLALPGRGWSWQPLTPSLCAPPGAGSALGSFWQVVLTSPQVKPDWGGFISITTQIKDRLERRMCVQVAHFRY